MRETSFDCTFFTGMNKLSMISSRNKGTFGDIKDPPRVLWAIEHLVGDDVTYVSSEWTLNTFYFGCAC